MSAAFLAGLEAFKTLSPEAAAHLEKSMAVKDYKKDHVFWKAGARIRADSRTVFVILDGQVSVMSETTDISQVPVSRVLNRGHLFGLITFFQTEAHTATCRAATPVRAASLTRPEFDKLCKSDAAVATSFMFAIAAQLARDVRACNDRLVKAIRGGK